MRMYAPFMLSFKAVLRGRWWESPLGLALQARGDIGEVGEMLSGGKRSASPTEERSSDFLARPQGRAL